MPNDTACLEIEGLSAVIGASGQRILRAVSLSLKPGEVHGLVGESGAGKSMIGKAIAGILPRSVTVADGSIRLDGQDLASLGAAKRRQFIGQNTAIIPQDPQSALNPSRRIGPQMTDRLTHTLGWQNDRANARALELLDAVYIRDAKRVMRSYPHELSGGMRQRVLIAAAFAAEPKLIIADEPTTALDVTVQKQILRLIRELQVDTKTAMLFVTHDLGVVSKICQQVSVLYSGLIVAQVDTAQLFNTHVHDYVSELIAATPRYDQPDQPLRPVSAQVLQSLQQEIARLDEQWRGIAHA